MKKPKQSVRMNKVMTALSKGRKVIGITGYLPMSKKCGNRCSCNGDYEMYLLVKVTGQRFECNELTLYVEPVSYELDDLVLVHLYGQLEISPTDLFDNVSDIVKRRERNDQVSARHAATAVFRQNSRGTAYARGMQLRKLWNSCTAEQQAALSERFAPELAEKGKKDIFSLDQYDQKWVADAIADTLFGKTDSGEDCEDDF